MLMKDYIITIDCGTTNTRAILWHGEEIVSVEKSETGVRNTAIDGNNSRLKQAVKGCIDALCEKNNLSFEDIKRVLASGMITSNVGLVEIPHLVVPVGLEELARGIQAVELEDVCPLAINFIPGVKNYGGELSIDGDFETMDIMRGEEVETMAVLQKYPAGKSYLLVLPGSHTKFVSTNEKGQITGCLTTIAGELLSAITRDTIIADAVGRQFVANEDYDKKWLLKASIPQSG